MPGRRSRYLVLPILAVGLLLGLSSRALAWTDPVSLSSLDARVFGSGIDPTGRATVAWGGSTQGGPPARIQARARRPDGSLGFIKTIASGSLSFPAFAMDGGGSSHFVWSDWDGDRHRVYYRSMSPAGALGPVLPISPPGVDAEDPRLSVNASGEAIIGWTVLVPPASGPGFFHRVQVRTVDPGGMVGPVQTVVPFEESELRDVAIDPSGDATIVWYRKAGIAAIQRSSGGTLGPVIPLDDSRSAQVAVDAGGNATVLYAYGDDLATRQLSSAGSLGPRLRVGTLERDSTSGDFTFGLDGSGTALIVWTPGFTGVPRDRTLSPSGTLGPVQVLSASMGREPAVGMNSSGDSVIAWRAQAPGNFNWQVQAAQRAANGDVGPTEAISDAGPRVDDPLVALNDGGQAIAAWNVARIQVSAGP